MSQLSKVLGTITRVRLGQFLLFRSIWNRLSVTLIGLGNLTGALRNDTMNEMQFSAHPKRVQILAKEDFASFYLQRVKKVFYY